MNLFRHGRRAGHVLVLAFLANPFCARAQDVDSAVVVLPAVEISAARSTESQSTAPFAVSVRTRSQEVLALEPALSLDEALRGVLGLNLDERGHLALGERMSVRGMGTRAAFGVRGIQVVLDGIPLTLPDGQAVVDVVDPTFIRSAELIRGPSSHFWGNTSGGVLFLSTRATAGSPTARVRVLSGSHGQRQWSGETAFAAGDHRIHVHASDTRHDGYRENSKGSITRAGAHASFSVDERSQIVVTGALALLDTEHPGALTREEVRVDDRQADQRFVDTRSGKESLQAQASATGLFQTSVGVLSGTFFGVVRDLDNPLPFAYIGLDRAVVGLRLALTNQVGRINWGAGFDAGRQVDDRVNRNNDLGTPGDDLRLDQRETVRNIAGFGYGSARLIGRVHASAGIRVDAIVFSSEDRLLANGDDSGSRTLSSLSPAFGLAFRSEAVLVFANFGTAFETPTTTELVNRPDLTGGFNENLEPQRVLGVEVGLRGRSDRLRAEFDVALFRMRLRDRLAPFQTAEGGARTFYRNDGRSVHRGIEMGLRWEPRRVISAEVQFTHGRFVFTDGVLDGNRLPGVPGHRILIHLRAQQNGFWSRVTVESTSSYYVDDENTARNADATLIGINAGHTGIRLGPLALQPFFAIGNLFDVRHNSSVVVNANGGRYFEPAPSRVFQLGISLAY